MKRTLQRAATVAVGAALATATLAGITAGAAHAAPPSGHRSPYHLIEVDTHLGDLEPYPVPVLNSIDIL
jgi:hypothetical protein